MLVKTLDLINFAQSNRYWSSINLRQDVRSASSRSEDWCVSCAIAATQTVGQVSFKTILILGGI
jgi:hypothetical protein